MEYIKTLSCDNKFLLRVSSDSHLSFGFSLFDDNNSERFLTFSAVAEEVANTIYEKGFNCLPDLSLLAYEAVMLDDSVI